MAGYSLHFCIQSLRFLSIVCAALFKLKTLNTFMLENNEWCLRLANILFIHNNLKGREKVETETNKNITESWQHSIKWRLWLWLTFGLEPHGRWMMLMLSDMAAHWLISANQASCLRAWWPDWIQILLFAPCTLCHRRISNFIKEAFSFHSDMHCSTSQISHKLGFTTLIFSDLSGCGCYSSKLLSIQVTRLFNVIMGCQHD